MFGVKMEMMQGTCPVCNGSGRVPAGNDEYKSYRAGYDKETDTHECTNCGGQYMFGKAKGKVRLNLEGVPCTHEYDYQLAGRCYHRYTCKHCGDVYHIDSGD